MRLAGIKVQQIDAEHKIENANYCKGKKYDDETNYRPG